MERKLQDAVRFEDDIHDVMAKWNRCYEQGISGLVHYSSMKKRMDKLNAILSSLDITSADPQIQQGVEGLRKRARKLENDISNAKDIEDSMLENGDLMNARVDDQHVIDKLSQYPRSNGNGGGNLNPEHESAIADQNEQLDQLAGIFSRHRQLGDRIYDEIDAQQNDLNAYDSQLEHTNESMRLAGRGMDDLDLDFGDSATGFDSSNERQSCLLVGLCATLIAALVVIILLI